MFNCRRCGAPFDESYHFCRVCGLPLGGPQTYLRGGAGVPTSRPLWYLLWSIILFLFFNILGTPLAVAGAFYVCIANSPACGDPAGALKKAKRLCIAATCVDAVTVCFLLSALIIYFVPNLHLQ